MAYIYEFSFLCETEYMAKKFAWYLSDTDKWNVNINGQPCKIYVQKHYEYCSEFWVSVVPVIDTDKNKIRWPSGDIPKEDQDDAAKFEHGMYEEIKQLPERINFLYASPGVEVTGFRDKKEIIDLLRTDCRLDGSIISNDMLNQSNFPPNWEKFSDYYNLFRKRDL